MLSAFPLHQCLMAAVWLAVVLLLILGVARAARLLPARLRAGNAIAGPAASNALTLRASLVLDLRRRVHLIEAEGHSMLVLTGGTNDVLIALRQQAE